MNIMKVMTTTELSAKLETDGYAVIQIFSAEEIRKISQQFLDAALSAPELQTRDVPQLAMGGVGYSPLASLAYHPIVRYIQMCTYEKVVEVFKPLINEDAPLFSKLPDRQLIRFPTQKIDEKGKWHQDDAANATDTDQCYGGWVNLNYDIVQYFKALPGTHNPDHEIFDKLKQKDGGRRGFANFKDKADYDFLENYWKKQGKKLIEIPPGYVMIFRETMIHTVFKNPPTKKCILRQHVSFMLSQSNIPLHDRPTNQKYKRAPLRQYFEDQALVPVRSGQCTPTYSPMNRFPSSMKKLRAMSDCYIPECRDDDEIVERYLPSMRKLAEISSIEMHPPMSEHEIGMYMPHIIV